MKRNTLIVLFGVMLSFQGVMAEECCEPVDYDCCGRGRYFAGADWLNWKSEQTKMEFAALVNQEATPDVVQVESTVIRPKFKRANGYRVFTGYETCDENWIFQAIYTHIPSHASVFENENPSFANDAITIFNTNFPLLSALINTPLNSVGGKWDVDTNYLDLDVGRNFDFCDCISLRPHLGMRGLWSHQTFKISGAGTDINFGSKLKERIQAFGLEGGVWGTIDCGCGFSLVGHVGGGLLYSKFENVGRMLVSASTNLDISYKDTVHQNLLMGDSFLGVRYATCFRNMLFNFHIGWEQHIICWTNQFSINGGGNLTLQGLTLGGSVSY